MGAVWMRLRAELRGRSRALLVLTLLAGLPAGVAIAAATGASRTGSAIDRLVETTRPPIIFMAPGFQETKVAFADIARLPVVSEALLFHAYGVIEPKRFGDLELGAPVNVEFDPKRTHLIAGRHPRPGRIEEALVNFRAVERYHWKVGDVVNLTLAARGADFNGDAPLPPGPAIRTKIVGISADPGDFAGIAGPGMTFGNSFALTHDADAASIDLYAFSLRRGGADLPEFEKGIRGVTGGKPVLYVDTRADTAQVRRSFHIQAAALWILCAFLGLVAGLIFAQAFARQTLLHSVEYGALRALGMTQRDLALLASVRAGIVALASALLAAGVAAALSPLTPLGAAGMAEPNPGLSLPAKTFGAGLGIAIVIVFLLATLSARVVARAVGRGQDARARPSAIARFVGLMTRRSAPAIGARFALESGRGLSAVPIRSSLAASVTGIVALLAALIVGASLQHLLATPSLYGWNWDIVVAGSFDPGSADLRDLTADPAIAAAAVGAGGESAIFRVGRTTMEGMNVDPVKGNLGPTILAGRAPVTAGEVALGPKSMHALHLHLGDSITLGLLGTPGSSPVRVVGQVVLPFDDDVSTVGEGLWMTLAATQTLIDATAPSLGRVPAEIALIRIAPGVDREATIARLRQRFKQEEGPDGTPPQTVRAFGKMSNLPAVLAGLLAALAAGTLAHMLTTSIRRRRRDLAILKTIGFARGQVRSAVGWQAIIFTAVALAIAVPLGVVTGRWTWHLIANYGGFAPAAAVPFVHIAIVVSSSLAAALILAALPARSAARTKPALVLRSE